MVRVQFRFLQLVLSHVTGDEVSVALLHWLAPRAVLMSHLEISEYCKNKYVTRGDGAHLRRAIEQRCSEPDRSAPSRS